MDARELRIGNWITHTNRNGSYELPVRGVINKGVYLDYVGAEWFVGYGDISAIQLTEEWLLKFGFEKTERFAGATRYYYGSPGSLFVINYGHQSDKYWFLTTECELNYVHEVQNIVYAITKQELEIKETVTP